MCSEAWTRPTPPVSDQQKEAGKQIKRLTGRTATTTSRSKGTATNNSNSKKTTMQIKGQQTISKFLKNKNNPQCHGTGTQETLNNNINTKNICLIVYERESRGGREVLFLVTLGTYAKLLS